MKDAKQLKFIFYETQPVKQIW